MKLTIDLDLVASKMSEQGSTTEWDYDLVQTLEEVSGLVGSVKKIMEEKYGVDFDEYML